MQTMLIADQNFQVTPHPYLRSIHPFSEIIRRDRGGRGDVTGRFKQKAVKELTYIYHMVDHRSPYSQYDREQRHELLVKAIFADEEKWKPDKLVIEGLERYEELTDTAMIRLLKASRTAINKLETFFSEINITEPKEAKELIAAMSSMAKVIDSLKRLEELVKTDQTEKTTYGNVKTNKYSE